VNQAANYERFVELKDRTPGSVSEVEQTYLKLLRDDAKKVHDKERPGFYEFHMKHGHKNRPINYFKEQLDYLQLHIGQRFPEDEGVAVNYQEMIDRCFWHNSVEEIMEALKKESHPFARQCLQAMESNSMTSMKLAL